MTATLAPIQIRVLPNFVFTINEAESKIPDNSVLRELACFKNSLPALRHPTTDIALKPDHNLPTEAKNWLHASSPQQRTATICHDGVNLWVDVLPSTDPTKCVLVVQFKTIDQCYNTWQHQIPILRLLLKEITNTVTKTPPKPSDYRSWKQLTGMLDRLLHINLQKPTDPQSFVKQVAGNGKPKELGTARDLIKYWKKFVQHPLNPLTNINSFQPRVTQLINEVERNFLIAQTSPDPFRPLQHIEAVGQAIKTLHQLILLFIRIHRSNLAATGHHRANFEATKEYIVNHIERFQLAAREVAHHDTIYGSLIESLLFEIIRRAVSPLSVHSGAIAELGTDHQIDIIIWDHQILPSVIEHGQIAVVPARCVCGIIEIKSTSNDVGGISSRLHGYADGVEIIRSDRKLVSTDDMKAIALPTLAVIVSSTQTYETIRTRSGNLATSLVFVQNEHQRFVNPQGVQDLLEFLYNRVLPTHRIMQEAIREHDWDRLR